MQLREVGLSFLVGLFLLSCLAVYPGSVLSAEFTVDGVVIDDGDDMQFVSFEDAAGTQYFDLLKNGTLKLNFVDDGQSTNYFLATQDFFNNEWQDLVGLGNTAIGPGAQGDTVYVAMAGPVVSGDGDADTIFFHHFRNGQNEQLDAHIDDVHRARPRNFDTNEPQLTAEDTGVVAVHDGSDVNGNSKPAGRYEYIPSSCPVQGFSGACWVYLATGKKAIDS